MFVNFLWKSESKKNKFFVFFNDGFLLNCLILLFNIKLKSENLSCEIVFKVLVINFDLL